MFCLGSKDIVTLYLILTLKSTVLIFWKKKSSHLFVLIVLMKKFDAGAIWNSNFNHVGSTPRQPKSDPGCQQKKGKLNTDAAFCAGRGWTISQDVEEDTLKSDLVCSPIKACTFHFMAVGEWARSNLHSLWDLWLVLQSGWKTRLAGFLGNGKQRMCKSNCEAGDFLRAQLQEIDNLIRPDDDWNWSYHGMLGEKTWRILLTSICWS